MMISEPPNQILYTQSRSYVTNSSRIAATTDLTDTIGADSRESLNTGGDGRSGNSKHGELHG
jgi:hypothetical protein